MDTSHAGSRLLFDNGGGDDPPPPAAPRPVSVAPPAHGPGAAAASPIGLVMAGSSKMFLLQPDRQFFPSHPAPHPAEGMVHNAYASSGQENRVGFQQWNASGVGRGHAVRERAATGTDEDNDDGDEDHDDDDGEDEDDDDEGQDGDGEVEGMGVGIGAREERLNSSTTAQSSSEKVCRGKENSQEDQSSFGSSRGGLDKDAITHNCQGSMSRQEPPHQRRRIVQYESNAATIAEPEIYYAQILQGGDVPSFSQKEAGEQGNGCGFSGRKDAFSLSNAIEESLRKHLSDPITGVLMDDAMILPCGHSYGSSGMQHIVRMKACSKCDQPFPDNSFRPNLALRSAVQAFRREEEALYLKSSRRRRERFEQDKCNFNELLCEDTRGKGVQFPFTVSDHVIIKGNKRTPPRFVGRLAVVTAQCLNGWYVVKTLDNAESVKLQYRSFAKAPDNAACTVIAAQATASNWL